MTKYIILRSSIRKAGQKSKNKRWYAPTISLEKFRNKLKALYPDSEVLLTYVTLD